MGLSLVHCIPSHLDQHARNQGSKITGIRSEDLMPAEGARFGELMMKTKMYQTLFRAAILASAAHIVVPAYAQAPVMQTATGQLITPTAIPGAVQQELNPGLAGFPNYAADEAVRSQLSPDGSTLAIITSGYNELSVLNSAMNGTVTVDKTQYIFIYNVAGNNKTKPVLQQVIQQANAHVGLVFSPDGKTLYATGGEDDAVYVYTSAGGAWSQSAKIALGHNNIGLGLGVGTNASGLGISADGKTLVVANNYNDSISVIDTATNTVRFEHDLRPFATGNEGQAGGVGGTFPFGVAVKGTTAYVSSDRDREVVVVDISAGKLIKRIQLDGNGLGLTLDKSQTKLYAAQDNADQIAVIDTTTNEVIETIDARAPRGLLREGNEGRYTGAATFSSTISPDGKTLYAVNSGANSIAVIPLNGNGVHKVKALIPTAYEPRDITFSADGSWMYIINGKSVTGPNPGNPASESANILTPSQLASLLASAGNQYQFRLERSSLVAAPVPSNGELNQLTQQVAQNNFYTGPSSEDEQVMAFLRSHIKHVIYVIKENRTFDQVLGDLNNGANVDPSLTQFGAAITPNFHALAQNFVTLDNFTDPGDGSMDGWSYALQGRVTNTETISQHINYGGHGLSYESEGDNRNVPVNLPTVAQRDASSGTGSTSYSTASAGLPGGTANLLTGDGDHASSDAPFGEQEGYIFDAVLRAGKTVRNYGALVNSFGSIGTPANPVMNPFAQNVIQVAPLNSALVPFTDVFFRGFDQNYPDLWRYNEWKREFDQFVSGHNLPNLEIVRISHDHMGFGSRVLAGLNTPELQQADDDLSAGMLVQAVANSPYASDTVIFITEDDAQDGADHVDSHRTTTYVVGPFVKKGAVVKTHYSPINVIRSIEDILGTQHINLNTAFQRPMSDVFNTRQPPAWTYAVTVSTVLSPVQKSLNIQLAMGDQPVKFAEGPIVKSKHNGEYWQRVTKGMNFAVADRLPRRFNQIIWKGMMGNRPYPKMAMDMFHQATKVDNDD
jgi:YVTN family beta-propeller protein